MWFEKARAFTHTSIWRFTLIFSFIVLLICMGMLALIYQLTIGEQNRRLEQQVESVIHGFSDLSSTAGVNETEFQRILKKRADNSTALVLALRTSTGTLGNLAYIPKDIQMFPSLQHFPIAVSDHLGTKSIALVLGSQIETSFGRLLVGLIDDKYHSRGDEFYTASLLALTFVWVVTLLVGYIFSKRVLLRVNQISNLTAEVKAGRLKTRLPLSRRNDEFDTIAMQINQMLDDIDDLVNSIAQVTDNIAHDLRTPLSRIRISVEESLSRVECENDEQWRLDIINGLDEVIATFNAMLELSRLQQGVQSVAWHEVDMLAICQDVVELAAPLAEQKEQALELLEKHQKSKSILIKGESNLLFRAIFNLVENSIKYTQYRGRICVSLQQINHRVVINIIDNGPGINKENRTRVFQRLYRVDSSRQGDGFGLGLPIVKAIVELHGASIVLSDAKPGLNVQLVFRRTNT